MKTILEWLAGTFGLGAFFTLLAITETALDAVQLGTAFDWWLVLGLWALLLAAFFCAMGAVYFDIKEVE